MLSLRRRKIRKRIRWMLSLDEDFWVLRDGLVKSGYVLAADIYGDLRFFYREGFGDVIDDE